MMQENCGSLQVAEFVDCGAALRAAVRKESTVGKK